MMAMISPATAAAPAIGRMVSIAGGSGGGGGGAGDGGGGHHRQLEPKPVGASEKTASIRYSEYLETRARAAWPAALIKRVQFTYGHTPMRSTSCVTAAFMAPGTFALSGRPRGGQRSTVQPPQLTSLAGRPRSTRRSIARWLQICDRHLKVCRNAAMLSSRAAASRPGGRGASTSSFHLLKVRVEDHFRASCRPFQALIRTGR